MMFTNYSRLTALFLTLADAIRSAFEQLGIQADTQSHDSLEEFEVLQSQAARLAGQSTVSLDSLLAKA
jgi:hypothetical protein